MTKKLTYFFVVSMTLLVDYVAWHSASDTVFECLDYEASSLESKQMVSSIEEIFPWINPSTTKSVCQDEIGRTSLFQVRGISERVMVAELENCNNAKQLCWIKSNRSEQMFSIFRNDSKQRIFEPLYTSGSFLNRGSIGGWINLDNGSFELLIDNDRSSWTPFFLRFLGVYL